jgi:hypothetical protein
MKEHARYLIGKKKSFWVHGSPGVAKSWTLALLCTEMNLLFRDDRLSQMDAVDLRGLLDLNREKGTSRWLPPENFPTENDPPGFWFLDEFPDAEMDVLKASYQLVHDRRLGDYKVPDHWAIGAAGNMQSDFSHVNRPPAALNNRFCHLYVQPEIEDWMRTAAIPGNFHPMVVGFLMWKPSWLHAFHGLPDNELSNLIRTSDAWHSCRTWEHVSDIIWDFGTDEEAIKKAFALIAGYVGLGAAQEFRGYVQYYAQLPDIDNLIANPTAHRMPTDLPVQWALASAVALKITADNLDNVLIFGKKLPDEIQAGMIIAAYRRDTSIANCDAFSKWATKNSQFLF